VKTVAGSITVGEDEGLSRVKSLRTVRVERVDRPPVGNSDVRTCFIQHRGDEEEMGRKEEEGRRRKETYMIS
jgi:hypothetical protein